MQWIQQQVTCWKAVQDVHVFDNEGPKQSNRKGHVSLQLRELHHHNDWSASSKRSSTIFGSRYFSDKTYEQLKYDMFVWHVRIWILHVFLHCNAKNLLLNVTWQLKLKVHNFCSILLWTNGKKYDIEISMTNWSYLIIFTLQSWSSSLHFGEWP